MKKYVLVKEHFKINKIIEINGKAHAITDSGTFKIKDNIHSNTFLVYNNSDSTVTGSVLKILELCPMDIKELYNSIPFSDLTNLQFKSFEGLINSTEIVKKYHLFSYENKLLKLKYKEMVRILMYLQSLSDKNDFNLFDRSTEINDKLFHWIINTYNGSSLELGFFILLDCLENERLGDFIAEWRTKDLFEIDLKALLLFVNESFLEIKDKSKIKGYLSKLV